MGKHVPAWRYDRQIRRRILLGALGGLLLVTFLVPPRAQWRSYTGAVHEDDWRAGRGREILEQRTLSRFDTWRLRLAVAAIDFQDNRTIDRRGPSAMLDGELALDGAVYGIDLSEGMVCCGCSIGWMPSPYTQWLADIAACF